MISKIIFWPFIISSLAIFICVCICTHHAFLPLPEIRHNLKVNNINIADGIMDRYISGLRYATISWNHKVQNFSAFVHIQRHIRRSYPLLHSAPGVVHEIVNNYSLLYIIKGTNITLKPALFLAHIDVVPTTGQDWKSDPFDPVIRDGFLYARGAVDDKGSLFALLEAAEGFLKAQLKPDRDIILAFGHDEEVSGREGAQKIAKRLQELGYREVEFLVDEGLLVLEKAFPGVSETFALIGTSLKGFMSVNLTVELRGGHSSMPDKESAIGILAKAVKALEDNPMPSRLGLGVEQEFLQKLARTLGLAKRIFLSNLWLFKPVVERILSSKPHTNALLRTTTALTMFNAGIKENVLAHRAQATINFRLHPKDSPEAVLAHVRAVIADPRVRLNVTNTMPSTPASPTRGAFGYELLEATVQQVFPHAVISPCLMIAMADAPWYMNFTRQLYFFNPTVMEAADTSGIHGKDERIRVTSYKRLVEFHHNLLRNLIGFKVAPKHEHVTEF